MENIPDGTRGAYPNGQNEEHSGRPDSPQDRNKLQPMYRQLMSDRCANVKEILFNDEFLLLISKRVGKEWRQIATLLGLQNCEVDRITMDCPEALGRIFSVFRLWRDKGYVNQPVQDLKEALVTVDRRDLADDVEDYLLEYGKQDKKNFPRRKVGERQSEPCVPGEESIEVSLCGFYDSTKYLRNSDRLGKSKDLPNFTAKYFDSGGGFLDIPTYDVMLMIPNGAIESGMVQEVYLHVGPQTVYQITETHTGGPLLGHLVTFGPPGLKFKRHVTLHIPLIESTEVDKELRIMKATDWSHIAADKDNIIVLKERQIIMVLSTFPRYCSELKKFMVCVTTPVLNPSEECTQFRVKLWDTVRCHHQMHPEEETTNIEVNLASGELDFKMINLHPRMQSVSGDGVYISTAKLKETSVNEVSFLLHDIDGNDKCRGTRRNGEHLCDIQIRQRSDHEDFCCVLLHVYFPNKKLTRIEDTLPDESPPDDSPSDVEHQEEYHPHLPKSGSERDSLDQFPPDMTKWTNDDVRQWLLYIGIPGVYVSEFVTAQTDGDELAKYSTSDFEENFTLNKKQLGLILSSRRAWLQNSGFVSTGLSLVDTSVTCNDFVIETETRTIHLSDKGKQSTTVDISVSVGVIKIPGGDPALEAVQLIADSLKKAVLRDSFSDLVMDIGNVFNENYAELVSLEGLTCIVRFHTREGLYNFGEKCTSGELADKLSQILITDEISQAVGSGLEIRLTLEEIDYVRGMKHFAEDI